jgi:CRP-like cAMP-binding protein
LVSKKMAANATSLKSSPYFSGLSDTALSSLTRYFSEKKADRGEILVYEGEPAEALFLVINGVVKVFKTSADGKEQIFGIIRPGETFNDVPVLSGGKNLVSAGAMSPVLLNGIKKKDMETIIKENPQVALNVVHVLSRRIFPSAMSAAGLPRYCLNMRWMSAAAGRV